MAAGLRQKQKAATRERVLTAARDLFMSLGYEGATIRQIANVAGVSVGSVFTSFASKGEVLSEVMRERLDELYAELDQLSTTPDASTAERLQAMFAVHFAFECRRLQLFLPHIAAAFDWTLAPEARPFGRNPRLQGLIETCLQDGVAAGEVASDADLRVIIDLLMAAYAWTYRLAAWENASAEAMTAVMNRQIEMIARGFAPRG